MNKPLATTAIQVGFWVSMRGWEHLKANPTAGMLSLAGKVLRAGRK